MAARVLRWLSILLLLLPTGQASAEIYRWTDTDGKVQFSDKPPAGAGAETVELRRINTFQSVSVDELPDWVTTDRQTVIIYSAVWCGVCNRAKQYFKSHNIPYREYDIETTSKGRQDFARLKARGVPVILVGDKRMNGFSPRRFEALYNG